MDKTLLLMKVGLVEVKLSVSLFYRNCLSVVKLPCKSAFSRRTHYETRSYTAILQHLGNYGKIETPTTLLLLDQLSSAATFYPSRDQEEKKEL